MKSKGKKINTMAAVRRIIMRKTFVTLNDLAVIGLSRATIFRAVSELVRAGEIKRISHGRYQLAVETNSADPWVMAQNQYPNGVICLDSALAFHGLIKSKAREIWIALPKGGRRRSTSDESARIIRVSGVSFTSGIECHSRRGGVVRVYSIAKTIADTFKFRNQIGIEIPLTALREGLRQKRCSLRELNEMAVTCRVERVMRPYVQAYSTP